jgi:integrase
MAEHFRGMLLTELQRGDVEGCKLVQRKKIKGAAVNRDLACLSKIFEHALEMSSIAENLVKGVRRIRFRDLRHTAASWMAQSGADRLHASSDE